MTATRASISTGETTPSAPAGRKPAASRRVRRLVLIVAYAIVLFGPLALIAGVAKAGAHGWLVILADALGFAGLSLLALQIVTSGRWAAATRSFGLRSVLSLHRKAGLAVVVLVVVHVGALFVDDPTRIGLLDPLTAPPRARAGGSPCSASSCSPGPRSGGLACSSTTSAGGRSTLRERDS